MSQYRLDETKENALIQWAHNAMGVTVIWNYQDVFGSRKAKIPELPFATLSITTGPSNLGSGFKKYKETETWEIYIRKRFTLSVDVFARNGHLELINNLQNSLAKDSVLISLRESGLSFWNHTEPSDITVIEETSHEFRATMDFVFSYNQIIEDAPGEIQTVKIYKENDPTFEKEISQP